MIIKCYNENHPYLLFIDIEFDNTHLIQFAGLLFKRIDTDGSYQLQTSINQYVSAKVGYPFTEYTGINNSFLDENGVPLSSLRTLIFDDVLGEVPMKDIMIIVLQIIVIVLIMDIQIIHHLNHQIPIYLEIAKKQ